MASTLPAQLPRLTSLRWFAALMVFACHVGGEGNFQDGWLLPGGPIGVGFFFVLSGLVLTWSTPADVRARVFWRNRFARIYPATFVSLMLGLSLWRIGVSGIRVSALALATSTTLTQSWLPGRYTVIGPNAVTWSLCCEAFFYLLLPGLLRGASTRTTRVVMLAAGCALAAGMAATAALVRAGMAGYAYSCPLVRLPEFILGIALGTALKRGWHRRVPIEAGVLLLGLGFLIGELYSPQVQVYIALPGIVTVLLAAAGSDIRGVRGPLAWRPLIYLGEISFSFYLVHKLILDAFTTAHQWAGAPLAVSGPGARVAALALLVTLGAAALLHHLVELPAQRRLRWRAGSDRDAPAAPARIGPVHLDVDLVELRGGGQH